MTRSKSLRTVKTKTTQLGIDQLEARMLCAIDTAITNIEALVGPADVSATRSSNVRNAAPTIARAITVANANQPILRSVSLSVHGRDDASESLLTYRWSVSSTTQGATGSFAANNNNTAKNTTLTFNKAGVYDIRVSVVDRAGLSATSTLRVTVRQVLTSVGLTPGTANVAARGTQQFTARGLDQFRTAMTTQPTFTWSTNVGSITSAGRYTAPTIAGNATITVRSGSIAATARVTVTNSTPTPSPAPSPTPSPTPTPTPSGLTDTSIRSSVTSFLSDRQITRTEMIALLRSAGNDGSVSASELADFRYIVSNASSFGVVDYVKVLTNNVVNNNAANLRYQGEAAGNLATGSSSALLNKLVDKWFMGTDLPALESGSLSYRTVAGNLFNGNPSTANMKQGQLGDCYFIAALGAIADRTPAAIQNMFVDNGDGTFTIRFYTGNYGMFYNTDGTISTGFRTGTTSLADYVTVNRSLATYASGMLALSGSGSYASSASNTLWIALAEKAYAQWNETGKAGRDVAANNYSSIEGGWMGEVSAQVLGYNATEYVLANSQQSSLTQALSANRAVTIGTKSGATLGGLVGGHAYVVSSYNASSNTFTLLNPWGTSHPAQLSWTQLVSACDWLSVANPSSSTAIAQNVSGGQILRSGADSIDVLSVVPVSFVSSVTVSTGTVVSEQSRIDGSTVAEDVVFAQAEDSSETKGFEVEVIADVAAIEKNADYISELIDSALSDAEFQDCSAFEFA
jgi:Calpain family cysteine protease